MHATDTHQTWAAEINGSGDIALSEDIRQVVGWEAGDQLVIEWDGYSVRITSIGDFTREMQRSFGPWQPGEPFLSDELLAERRRSANAE